MLQLLGMNLTEPSKRRPGYWEQVDKGNRRPRHKSQNDSLQRPIHWKDRHVLGLKECVAIPS